MNIFAKEFENHVRMRHKGEKMSSSHGWFTYWREIFSHMLNFGFTHSLRGWDLFFCSFCKAREKFSKYFQSKLLRLFLMNVKKSFESRVRMLTEKALRISSSQGMRDNFFSENSTLYPFPIYFCFYSNGFTFPLTSFACYI